MKENRYYNSEGKVGVLYSPVHGAGWSNGYREELLFDPEIIKMVLNGEKVTPEYCKSRFGNGCYYEASSLKVEFLEPGTQFTVEEYDGCESIKTILDINWIEA